MIQRWSRANGDNWVRDDEGEWVLWDNVKDLVAPGSASDNTNSPQLLSRLEDIRNCLAGCDPQDHAVAFDALTAVIAQLRATNIAMAPCPAFMRGCTHDLCPFQKTCGVEPCLVLTRYQ